MSKSKVYFVKLNELNKIKDLLPSFDKPLGVKVHFGERGNISFVPAVYIKQIVEMINEPTLIETSVLYKSARRTAIGHKELAIEHGFDFAPVDFLDGEFGDDFMQVDIKGKHFQKAYLGKGLEKYKSLLVISHFKGHEMCGFGGALKNLGMGLASRRGKLAQHSSIKHEANKTKCVGCGLCVNDCPVNAIFFDSENKAEINKDICISCSKCISVCPQEAIRIPWKSIGREELQERVAEYASAGAQDRNCFFINFVINIVHNCDCNNEPMEKITADVGVLVSDNPVAIDQASYDLVLKQFPDFINHESEYQLKHTEELGLGSRQYELINI
ncbi:MAG: DUF362 domain-containing protein [Patescibacteria group bacterium]|nr:DUF362 domain-containing protein [Patescibacteria group bacterium]MDD4611366.1 DUF362 domain-containing protein [Patescibacteria group bacterium]